MAPAYRRSLCDAPERRFPLRGLEGDARYEVRDLDAGTEVPKRFGGRELMRDGLLAALPDRPRAAILTYRRSEG